MDDMIEAKKGQALPLVYRVREAAGSERKPGLVLLLHGIGSNEHDLFRLANGFASDMVVISARAPFMLAAGRYSWFCMDLSDGKSIIDPKQVETSRLMLIEFITQLIEEYHVDTARIFLGGFSQGGIMSYSVGLTFPQKFKGIFILSGRLLPEIKTLIKAGTDLENLNVFIGHGRNDEVLPLSYAHEVNAYLKQLTPNISYHEYNMGHSTGQQELADLREWLHHQQA